jgi:hypothetical protein
MPPCTVPFLHLDKTFKETDEPVQIDGNTVVLDVLCPDWDILIEIQEALSHLPGLRLKFVKGHQDDSTPYARLPLLARLNVDADAMAGKITLWFFLPHEPERYFISPKAQSQRRSQQHCGTHIADHH